MASKKSKPLAWLPLRVRKLIDKARQDRLRRRVGRVWEPRGNGAAKYRRYESYEQYLKHQRAKMEFASICPLDLEDYDRKYRLALAERLQADGLTGSGKSALCLGARLGTEVKAFLDLGFLALGIDLKPGEDNRYVLAGDFHDIQFPDGCFDLTFSNSLDHAYDLEKTLAEVKRVLKPWGLFVVEAPVGEAEGGNPGYYESLYWERLDDLVSQLEQSGFSVQQRRPIDYPFPGQHLVLGC